MSDLVIASSPRRLSPARLPRQARSQARVAAVLAAAERMIAQDGPAATTIPEIARLAQVPRASVYQFFPDIYALFARLSENYLAQVAAILAKTGATCRDAEFDELLCKLVNAASDFYDATPAAGILVLGGPFSQSGYFGQEATITVIGRGLRDMFAHRNKPIALPDRPDVATLAVEIAFACLKHGYFRDGRLTIEIRGEAARAARAYLNAWLPDPL